MLTKKFAHIAIATGCLLAILFLHNQIVDFILSLTAEVAGKESGPLAAKMHLQYRDGVIMGVAGIVVYCLLRALEKHLSEKDSINLKNQNIFKVALQLLRWAVVLVSGDIVMQNFNGAHTTISDYSMRYQTVGALLAIEVLIP